MPFNALSQWKTVHEAFKLLFRKDRQKLSIVTFVHITLGFLDLLRVQLAFQSDLLFKLSLLLAFGKLIESNKKE